MATRDVCEYHAEVERERKMQHAAIMEQFERGEARMAGLQTSMVEIKEAITGDVLGRNPGVTGQLRQLTDRLFAVEQLQTVVRNRAWEVVMKSFPAILGMIAGGFLMWLRERTGMSPPIP